MARAVSVCMDVACVLAATVTGSLSALGLRARVRAGLGRGSQVPGSLELARLFLPKAAWKEGGKA